MTEDSLRFNGPLKVKATPNLAVRVGKTQSAYEEIINVIFDIPKVLSHDKPCRRLGLRTPVYLCALK